MFILLPICFCHELPLMEPSNELPKLFAQISTFKGFLLNYVYLEEVREHCFLLRFFCLNYSVTQESSYV